MNAEVVYFRILVKFQDGDSLFADVCHWIRITGSGKSYVEASFAYTSFPIVDQFPDHYYHGSVSDITRLHAAVESKANEIFAGLLQRLREKHS